MAEYKFHYFSVTGRGEVSRYMFKLADEPFEDIRYKSAEWGKKKADAPFGQMPYLEVDGTVICQSRAIERFLAKRFDRYGSNDLEQAKADMVVDSIEDVLQDYFKASTGDDEGKEDRKTKWVAEKFPDYMEKLEKFATPTGFIEGKSLMWPDLSLVFLMDTLSWFIYDKKKELSLEKTPKLLAITKVVVADPKICQWIKERPASGM